MLIWVCRALSPAIRAFVSLVRSVRSAASAAVRAATSVARPVLSEATCEARVLTSVARPVLRTAMFELAVDRPVFRTAMLEVLLAIAAVLATTRVSRSVRAPTTWVSKVRPVVAVAASSSFAALAM